MIKCIFTGNTVAFTAIPTIDGKKQSMEGTKIGFIVKKHKDDADDKALISKESTDGHFVLTPQDTDIECGHWHYELRWFVLDAIYTLEMGTIDFVQTVYN